MNNKTTEHIRCADCEFARPDKSASSRTWTAFECGNDESEYHRCLLNFTPNGDKQPRITWTGCELGERRQSL
ncbi:MAG: hypothetical protein C4570_01470 [Ammonifex sp.]|jgi:hypothetical protein|nr:MAG: hypothetical protein C4570_01470 [Ammonifex sp.]